MRPNTNVEVQDIFTRYGSEYRQKYKNILIKRQYRAMHAIEICRTSALGGHVEKCDTCGKKRISYNSCRNRHCPKCQFLRKEKWLEDRLNDFLPVQYFHTVFTIPDTLNSLALHNPAILYKIFFQSSSETLKELSKDKKFIGAEIGFISILHTWGQNLMLHPHVHCIVTGGGLSNDKLKWISSRNKFLFPVKVMAKLYKGKFLDYLQKSYKNGDLKFSGKIINLKNKSEFKNLVSILYKKDWVVYSKPPFKNPETVLKYLSNYTHRIAISNQRIIKIENKRVHFFWKDYSNSSKKKVMILDVNEFIRRFLLHVLPDKFVKIRHYGLLGNRNKTESLKRCRKLLSIKFENHVKSVLTWQEKLLQYTGIDICCCPYCKKGKMISVEFLFPKNCNSPPQGIAV